MKKLIIDTNLLVLYVVGSIDNAKQIKNSKKLKGYTDFDYYFLLELMADFEEFYFTPYIAAETSNLLHRDLNGWARDQVFSFLRELFTGVFKIIDANPKKDTEGYTFLRYGLTDNSFIHLINEYVVLTNDKDIPIALAGIKPENVMYYNLLKEVKLRSGGL